MPVDGFKLLLLIIFVEPESSKFNPQQRASNSHMSNIMNLCKDLPTNLKHSTTFSSPFYYSDTDFQNLASCKVLIVCRDHHAPYKVLCFTALLNLYYKTESLVKFIIMLKQSYTKICAFLDVLLACEYR